MSTDDTSSSSKILTREDLQGELESLLSAAYENDVELRGGWVVPRDNTDEVWDIEITKVAK